MGKGGGSVPQVQQPDPAATARAQAEANRITQFTPFGDIIFGTTGQPAPGSTFPTFNPSTSENQAASQIVPSGAQQDIIGNLELGGRSLAELGARTAINLPRDPLSFGGLPSFQSQLNFAGVPQQGGGSPFNVLDPGAATTFGTSPNPRFTELTELLAGTPQQIEGAPIDIPATQTANPARASLQAQIDRMISQRQDVDTDFATGESTANPQFAALQSQLGGLPEFIESSPAQTGPGGLIDNPEFQRIQQELALVNPTIQGAGGPTGGIPLGQQSSNFPAIEAVPRIEDFSADAARQEQATFDRAFSLLQPELQFQQGRLDQNLANRGLPIGSEAEGLETGRFNRTRAELLNQLALGSVGAGRAEQSRLFNQALQSRGAQTGDQLTQLGLTNQARATGFTEQSAVRGNQFNELAALLGLQQVQPPGINQFVPPGQVDILGSQQLAQNAQLANQRAALQDNAFSNQQGLGLMSGLFGLGSAGIFANALSGGTGLINPGGFK